MVLSSVPNHHGIKQSAPRVLTPAIVILALSLLRMALPCRAQAEEFTGKVVGISDGDTLSVLRDGKAVKVRLYGVDTPEKAQAFGTQARKFTSDLVFQQIVTVQIRSTDRYGRLVGEVLVPGGRSLNHELVQAGMAWWYKQYAPNEPSLAALEAEARAAKRGLWTDPAPVPPWQWRRESRTKASAPATLADAGEVRGNRHSKVYRVPGCKGYAEMKPASVVPFPTEEAAQQAGYRKAKACP
jgi:endonuclease YncB( thermonuclease family)